MEIKEYQSKFNWRNFTAVIQNLIMLYVYWISAIFLLLRNTTLCARLFAFLFLLLSFFILTDFDWYKCKQINKRVIAINIRVSNLILIDDDWQGTLHCRKGMIWNEEDEEEERAHKNLFCDSLFVCLCNREEIWFIFFSFVLFLVFRFLRHFQGIMWCSEEFRNNSWFLYHTQIWKNVI